MTALGASALVALGGAIGALMRFWLSVAVVGALGAGLPYATFAANLAGSFAIGACAALFGGNAPMVAFAMTGVLGGFTTFSTFSLETVRLLEDGRLVDAAGYVGLSVVCCVAGAALGLLVGRGVIAS